MSETSRAGSEARTDTDASHAEKSAHLTAYQRDLLQALDHLGPSKGLEVKAHVDEYYGEETNHGRLYPNLDDLADNDLIQKRVREADDRSNEYELTDDGRRVLQARREWTNEGGRSA